MKDDEKDRDSTPTDVPRGEGGKWLAGHSANPGGKPKKLREIEQMLDDEHRSLEEMRETFRILKMVARGVPRAVYHKGVVVGEEIEYSTGHMEIYLNRTLGPVKEWKIDLTDAPPEVLEYLTRKMN